MEEPASPGGSVEETVALDELGLTVHLHGEADERSSEKRRNQKVSLAIILQKALTVQDTRMEAAVSMAGSCSWTATSPSSL